MGSAVGEVAPETEVTLEREQEPVVVVPSHAMWVTPTLLVVGWCCWDAPLHDGIACSLAHSARAGVVHSCRGCGKEYGVFANRSASNGALVLVVR